MMNKLRNSGSPFPDTVLVIDYLESVKAEEGFGTLPQSDVLKFILEDGSWIAVRPSGTEPKIKIYYSVKDENKKLADQKLQTFQTIMRENLGLN